MPWCHAGPMLHIAMVQLSLVRLFWNGRQVQLSARSCLQVKKVQVCVHDFKFLPCKVAHATSTTLHPASCAVHAAKQLARIADWYGFEGWLVNIESNVNQGVVFLDVFLRVLTSEMHNLRGQQALVLWCVHIQFHVHTFCPTHPAKLGFCFIAVMLLIVRWESRFWCRYDACDSTGQVKHWCTLNYLNYPFFEVCNRAVPCRTDMSLHYYDCSTTFLHVHRLLLHIKIAV